MNNKELYLPVYAEELVRLLDERFPPKCIGKGQTPEQAHRYAGKRELIDHLLWLRKQSEENDLRSELNVHGSP
jgi:hypothetical protein